MSSLTGDDWRNLDEVLDRKLKPLHEAIKESGTKVHRLDTAVSLLRAGSPHKCAEEIEKHEAGSWSHNPKKAMGLAAAVLGIVEGVREFFHHIGGVK